MTLRVPTVTAVFAVAAVFTIALAGAQPAAAAAQPAGARAAFDPGLAGFTATVRGIENRYGVLGIYVLPGAKVTIKTSAPARLTASAGTAQPGPDPGTWVWTAPDTPGRLVPLVLRSETGSLMTLNAFILYPADRVQDGSLKGYRIGQYPREPYKGLPVYNPPKGFVEVTAENADTPVSPHFTLGQFVCKQAATGPSKFVVLREALLLKLERILQAANAEGIRADTFHVMSGYRTPYYNHAIGNRRYSRHIYGGAADIFVDESPRDGGMDDLNGDGKINRRDAALLYDLIERLSRSEGWRHPGGLGEYGISHNHGPFVHVDARGQRARWGR